MKKTKLLFTHFVLLLCLLSGLFACKEDDTENTSAGAYLQTSGTVIKTSESFESTLEDESAVKVTNGKLTLGIRQDKTVATDWVIMDNFTLTYYGPNNTLTETGDYTGIEDVQTAEAAVAKVEYFGINGEKKSSFTKGINIVKVTLADGSTKVRKVIVK